MKSYEQIRQEVGDAVDCVRTGVPAPNIVSTDQDYYKSLAELPSNDPLDWSDELYDFGPCAVTVETVEEFALVYRALGEVHRQPIYPYLIDDDIKHEQAHCDAAERVSFRQRRYGLLVVESNDESYSWRPFHQYADPSGRVTKLGIGSLIAAPDILSDGDKLRLHSMGYEDASDVAMRIYRAKDPELLKLWVPSSAFFPRTWLIKLKNARIEAGLDMPYLPN